MVETLVNPQRGPISEMGSCVSTMSCAARLMRKLLMYSHRFWCVRRLK